MTKQPFSFFRMLNILLFLTIANLLTPPKILAAPTQPRLPSESEYKGQLFNLYKFMHPDSLQLIENRDLTRKDIKQQIISDTRPKTCTVGDPNACKGGEVRLRNEVSPGKFEEQTLPNREANARCIPDRKKAETQDPNYNKETSTSDIGLPGKCDYNKYPSNSVEVTSVDYSKSHGLAYPKIQNTTYLYGAIGQTNNIVSFGIHNLTFNIEEQYALKAIALAQAAETENTVSDTGEWPLGGTLFDAPIDPQNQNSPSYLELWNEFNSAEEGSELDDLKQKAELLNMLYWPKIILPKDLTAQKSPEEEAQELQQIKNAKERIFQIISNNLESKTPPAWVKNFLKVPTCGPGITRGYTFVSKCALGTCTYVDDAIKTPVLIHINGRRTTFADHTARQDLCYAVIELRRSFNSDQSDKILRKLIKQNPLYPYALTGSTTSIPSKITKRYEGSGITNTSDIKVFSIAWFHKVLDGWRSPDTKYWYEKLGYKIAPKGTPETAVAYEEPGFFGVIKNLLSISIVHIFPNGIDGAFQILDHYVNLMSIQRHMVDQLNEILNAKDLTVPQQEQQATLTENYNNSVGNELGESFSIGNKTAPIAGKTAYSRILACGMQAYSTFGTPIKDYIKGLKQSCFDNSAHENSPICKAEEANDNTLTEATQKIGAKYGIPAKWLEGMFKLEGGFTQMGDNCVEKNNFKVMGPMQITTSAYKLVTCENERILTPELERTQCNDATKISRCSLEGSLELAARVLLQKMYMYGSYSGDYTCKASKISAKLDELFRATNAYGACARLADGKSYAEWVCTYAGNCPSPLPKVGAPVSCEGN